MKKTALAAWPLALVAVVVGIGVLARLSDLYYYGAVAGMKLVTIAACVWAMRQFRPTDYLYKAWLLNALAHVFLFADNVINWRYEAAGVNMPPVTHDAWITVIIIANIVTPISVLFFARALRVAGLRFPGSVLQKALVVAVACGLAALLSGPAIVDSVKELIHGQRNGLTDLFISVGDAVPTVLLAPLLMTVLFIRGGTLVWPFALYTGSVVAWMLYDATGWLADHLPLHGAVAQPLTYSCWMAGVLYIGAAAVSHVDVMRVTARQFPARGRTSTAPSS
jgi:hypothetical protein